MGHAEVAQGVEVIAFDDQVPPSAFGRGCRGAQGGIKVEGHEVGVHGLVPLNLVRLPDEPESGRIAAVARLEKADEFVVGQVIVARRHPAP